VLLQPKSLDVNIGSKLPITVFELTTLILEVTSNKDMKVLGKDRDLSNYVLSAANFR
jgi:hypothetical protein